MDELETLRRENEKLRAQLKRKNFGLSWLDVPEAFDTTLDGKLPTLLAVPELDLSNNGATRSNILIEGENYHALSCLTVTHAKKIDVIYIDPPYNTGSDGFRYRDKRVLDRHPDGELIDKHHPLRHSAWLSFMEKRLRLARALLAEDGVIFISIDDNEYAQLKLLCDEIFVGSGGSNLIGTLVWQRAKGGGNSKKFVRGHEYVLCYSMQADLTLTQVGSKAEDHVKRSQSPKYSDEYVVKDGDLYFINDDVVRRKFGKYDRGTERRCEYENLLKYKNQRAKDEIDLKIAAGEYVLRQQPSGLHYICRLERVADMRQVMYSIIQGVLSEVGNSDLEALGLGGKFDFPKPVELVKTLLNSVRKKSGIYLDFFAGSGTTGQAVMELNSQDGGDRQYILCTNNENEIAVEVTRARLERVSEGYGTYEAIPSGLRYFRTSFVGHNEAARATDEDRLALAAQANWMLALAEGTLDLVTTSERFYIFKDEVSEKKTAIYFSEEMASFEEFKVLLAGFSGETVVYLFSWGNETDFGDEIVRPGVSLRAMPQQILDVYRRINEGAPI